MTLVGYKSPLRWLEVSICTAKRRGWRPAYKLVLMFAPDDYKETPMSDDEWDQMSCDCGCAEAK